MLRQILTVHEKRDLLHLFSLPGNVEMFLHGEGENRQINLSSEGTRLEVHIPYPVDDGETKGE